ncbi:MULTISPECIES: glycosyltransferase [unclassified Leptolyngbya]|uniref:glycosyltransferase n=1 Tax=unclassified Leptolyngbya TaxID=2650499 RepID=UPI001682E510|nr:MULTISPECIES: glycosyltransferase [unclassified Leptolyngbya]MBD1909333.1 glycosyltransferase family 1 protein [Leptolyngbya sp. FACHB-8]MBD2158191.1 glycosyltransferase family 1 protein [Leptolyngbya sp. FACHB-16]
MIQSRRITVLAIGSTGDLYPYCALALGLQEAGHQVRVATNSNFETFVRGLGLDFAAIAGDYQVLLRSELGQKLLQGEMVKLIEDDLLQQQMNDALAAAQGTEVFIFNHLAIWGYHVAERLAVPSFLAPTVPLSPTRQFPFLNFSEDTVNLLKGGLNYASYLLVELSGAWQSHTLINTVRKAWGLSPLPALGPRFRSDKPPYLSPLPILYGVSPSIMPKPRDWRSSIYMTGAWFLDRLEQYEPPTALVKFLEAGETPICIGFGSMADANSEVLTDIVIDAVAASKQRAILLSGWGALGRIETAGLFRDQVFVVESVPHSWLFSRVKTVVHHGGAGTTAAVCRAGLPSVVVPFFADQIGWAKRLHQLGVSPEPISRKQLTVESLAAAIETATGDPVMQQKAAQLGMKVNNENGVQQAVSVIHQHLESIAIG